MKFNLLKTRRGKLEAKLKLELATPSPKIETILKCIDDYEKDNLSTIEKLKKNKLYSTKRISGALKQTITAHGPITKLLIGSATKRIYGALLDTANTPTESIKQRRIIWLMFELTVWIGLIAYILTTLCK